MIYRKIGKSKLKLSVIGFGAWGISGDLNKVDFRDMSSVIRRAYDLGINFFDTAPIYGYEGLGPKGFGTSEKLLGQALKDFRDKAIIATKFGVILDENGKGKNESSRQSIKKEIDDSLRRLRTDYIDLYQAHWPDPNTSIEEIFLTLNELKKIGKIRHIGVCNYSIEMMNEAIKYSEIVSSQNQYNIIQRNTEHFYHIKLLYKTEKEILPFCEKNNLGFFPYAPFCQGLLTGKMLKPEDFVFSKKDFRKGNTEFHGNNLIKNLELIKKLKEIANKINRPLTQLVINWLVKDHRITSIIAGPTKISEVEDNVDSASWILEDEVYNDINNLITKY